MKLIFVSKINNPSGVIGWSWERVNDSQKIPNVVLPIFLFFAMEYLIPTDLWIN